MELIEGVDEFFEDVSTLGENMVSLIGEDVQNAFCCWKSTLPSLGVEWEARDLLLYHFRTHLTFDKGIEQQNDEIKEHQGFDAIRQLKVDGSYSEDSFEVSVQGVQ